MKFRRKQSRRAVSEVIATIVLISVTVVLGSAVWLWANSQAVASEGNFNKAAGEKFEIVSATFSQPAPSSELTLYFYNSGSINTELSTLVVSVASVTPGVCPLQTVITTISGGTTLSLTNAIPYTTTATTIITTATSSLPLNTFPQVTIALNPPAPLGSLVSIRAIGQSGFYTTFQVQNC